MRIGRYIKYQALCEYEVPRGGRGCVVEEVVGSPARKAEG